MSKLVAVLGPTNTGKTHYALERMLAYRSGMIGLPLRLLAREIYDKVVAKKGEAAVALVTGEERIWPETARYFICTVEAMPLSQQVDFLAIDEIQLASDPDRGHVFTHRILHARGSFETLLLGSEPMRNALIKLGLDVDTTYRERFSDLTYVGPMKATKLPKRSAIVAFSAEEVYAIAELLKRQRGGSAVVMGALSPRTRNAQVDMYQSGEVDYLVATDAIGMGLNLDVEHIAFASLRKFDGRRRRLLTAAEAGQIAGRAGRFRTDGTFGETGDCPHFDEEMVQRIENHTFEPVDFLQWRNYDLSYKSIDNLLKSLSRPSGDPILRQTPDALDESTLRRMSLDTDVQTLVDAPRKVKRLWDLCCLPDFRRTGLDGHFRVVQNLFSVLHDPDARLSCEWMERELNKLRATEGDLDVLQNRLAAIRTWTYAANRSDWVEKAETWRSQTREIEDLLSDALHERLTQRFVDKRTTALMRGLSGEDTLEAGFGENGEITIEGHVVGKLEGLVFHPVTNANTVEGKAVRNAAMQALAPILVQRLTAICEALPIAFGLNDYAQITFDNQPIARVVKGHDWLSPRAELIGADNTTTELREQARKKAEDWLLDYTQRQLPALSALKKQLNTIEDLPGSARGLAYRVLEAGAAVDLREDDPPLRLSPEEREALKGWGIRAGRVAAYAPETTKPAQQALIARLISVFTEDKAMIAPSGAGSFAIDDGWTETALHAQGYLMFGKRAIRADLAERLAWEIDKRRKEAGKNHFEIPAELASVVSCPGDVFTDVLKGLGLVPAENDPETGAPKAWKYKARSRPEGRPERRPRKGPPSEQTGGERPARAQRAEGKGGKRPPRGNDKGKPNKSFAAQKAEARKNDPDNPFAALASLLPPEPPPKAKPKKKKKPKPPAAEAAADTPVETAPPPATETDTSSAPNTAAETPAPDTAQDPKE